MKKHLLILVLLLLAIFVACDEDPYTNNIDSDEDIMPLAVGNSWTYRVTTYDEFDNVMSTNEQTAEIIGSEIYDDETYYRISWQGFMYDGLYLRNENNGLWHHGSSFYFLDNPEMLFAKMDYDSMGYYVTYNNEVRFVASYTRTVYVDGDGFECYFYNSYPNDYEYRNWFICPGIGPIRIEMHHYWHLRSLYELVSYQLN